MEKFQEVLMLVALLDVSNYQKGGIMGGGSYSAKDWNTFSKSRAYSDPKTTTKDIYKKSSLDKMLDPKEWKIRESVDGPDNPQSTPVVIGLDVTGSMSPVLDSIARKGLKTICEEIYNRKPVTNPHICTLGIGDMECDDAPFQATQFEADVRIFEQLEKLYLESGGGGNDHESYILAWYFAKYRTKTDSFSKRGKKGFIFTIGDEEITPVITEYDLKHHLGETQTRTFLAQELFELVSAEWNIYHIIIKEGNHASRCLDAVKKSWENVIGIQKTIVTEDHTKIAEIIVSILEMMAGKDLSSVVNSWDGSTAVVVKSALQNTSGAITPYSPRPSIDDCL